MGHKVCSEWPAPVTINSNNTLFMYYDVICTCVLVQLICFHCRCGLLWCFIVCQWVLWEQHLSVQQQQNKWTVLWASPTRWAHVSCMYTHAVHASKALPSHQTSITVTHVQFDIYPIPACMCRLLYQAGESECQSVRGVRSWHNSDMGCTTRIWRHCRALVQSSFEQLLPIQLFEYHHSVQNISMGKPCSIHVLLCLSESWICPLSVHLLQQWCVFQHRWQSGWVHTQ